MNIHRRAAAIAAICVTSSILSVVPVHAEDQTPEQQWTAAVEQIVERDGVSPDVATARLVNLLAWHHAVEQIMARDGLTFDQAARNLALFLRSQLAVRYSGQWHDVAIAAGWQEWEWPKLSCIINRESGGNPNARSRTRDSGLTQINDVNVGFLRNRGIISSRYDLFDPYTNLRAARALYELSGWQPWVGGRRC